MTQKTHLKSVAWGPDQQGFSIDLDALPGAAAEIYMVADGNGPMGYYDRIHVIFKDGTHSIFPAHHAGGWVLLDEKESPL